MITFPIGQHASLIVISPDNIARLKEGKPLKVGEHLVCFTPDIQEFAKALGLPISATRVAHGEQIRMQVKLSPEQLEEALRACQHLPESVLP